MPKNPSHPTGPAGRAVAIARNLYYQLLDASPEDQVLVYRALRARLADDVPAGERQEQALQCARACARDTAQALPSKKTYVAWCSSQPDPTEWLSDKAIRNAFGGSWTAMLARLGAGAVPDPGALRLLASRVYTRAGLLATIQAWHASIEGSDGPAGRITQAALHAWIEERRAEGDRRDLELPTDSGIWIRHFGGWHAVLAEAGILAHRSGAARGTRRGRMEDEGDDVLLAQLARAGQELGKAPTRATFDLWVSRQVREAEAANRVLVLHRSSTFVNRFGSWARALCKAGLIDGPEARKREWSTRGRYTREQLLDCVDDYLRARGPGITIAAYADWRDGEIKRRNAQGDTRPVPSERLLRSRFGSLANAETQARARRSHAAGTTRGAIEGRSAA